MGQTVGRGKVNWMILGWIGLIEVGTVPYPKCRNTYHFASDDAEPLATLFSRDLDSQSNDLQHVQQPIPVPQDRDRWKNQERQQLASTARNLAVF